MQKKRRIAFIGTYPGVSELFSEIASHTEEIEAFCVDASFERAAECAREREPELDAILSRGGTAEYIRKAVSIPVVAVPITPFEVIEAIHQLPPATREVALVYHQSNHLRVNEIEKLFDIRIYQYHFEDYGDIERSIQDANEHGIGAVIGGEVASLIAKKYSMVGVTVSVGYEDLASAIHETLQILRERDKEKKRSARVNAAFASLLEGLVILDTEGRIVFFNDVGRDILGTSCRIGDRAGESFFNAYCRRICQAPEENPELNEVRRIGSKIYAVSYSPVWTDQECIGVVCRYENETRIQNLEQKVRREVHAKGFVAKKTFDDIISSSGKMRQAVDMARIYATADSSVLIQGPSGSGKELFAQGIHNGSARKSGPFVAVNCTAIPSNLLESELFGYEAGAFTGARKEGKAGLFEMAHGGTLFLDEIGEISEQVQASLLRVLQEREIMRVGGSRVIPVDTRIVSATNRDLWHSVRHGSFRADLYYRLNVFHLDIPPLRDRAGDVAYFCRELFRRQGREEDSLFTGRILPMLEAHSWPGNIRELLSVMERYSLLCSYFSTESSDEEIRTMLGLEQPDDQSELYLPPCGNTLKDICEEAERQAIQKTLRACGGDQEEAARRLGISRTTMWRKLKGQ